MGKLQQSEELYYAVIQQMAEAIHLLDVETKRVLESNPAFQRLLGYTPEELKNLTVYNFVAHERESIDDHIYRRELIILDIYNKVIPSLKKAYKEDKDWAKNRDIFRNEMHNIVSKK